VTDTEAIQGPADGFIFSDNQEDDVQRRDHDTTNENDPRVEAVVYGANGAATKYGSS
jgi:hypothetical protein